MVKDIFKRISAFLMCFTVILGNICVPITAAPEKSGYWQFDRIEGEDEHTSYDGWTKTEIQIDYKTAPEYYSIKWTSHTDYYSASGYQMYTAGQTAEATATTSRPKNRYSGGEMLSIDANLKGTYEEHSDLSDIAQGIGMSIVVVYENDGYEYLSYGGDSDSIYTSWEEPSVSTTFKCTLKSGRFDGQEMDIKVRCNNEIHYIYKWVAPEEGEEPPVIGEEEEQEEEEEEEEEEEPHWVFDGTIEEYVSNHWNAHGNTYDHMSLLEMIGTRYTWSGAKGNYRFSKKVLYNETNDYDSTLHGKYGCKGENAAFKCTSKGLAADYFADGAAQMILRIQGKKSKYLCDTVRCDMGAYITGLNPPDDGWGYHLAEDGRETNMRDEYGESWLSVRLDDPKGDGKDVPKAVSAYFPSDAKEGDYVYITITAAHDGLVVMKTGYRYVYVTGEGAGVPVPLSEDTITDKPIDVNIHTKASELTGEDPEKGENIVSKIILGLAGAVGAAGAAAAAGAAGSANGKTGDDETKSRFTMYIYKDFGDYIKKGAPPEGVFARIAEITPDGAEKDRPDLSEGIHIYSGTGGLQVTEINGMQNGYKGAEVCIPDENMQEEDGIVVISYSGLGGSFTNNVHFRLIGDGYIEMIEPPIEEGPEYETILVIEEGKVELPFRLKEFIKEPDTLICVTPGEDSIVKGEITKGDAPYEYLVKFECRLPLKHDFGVKEETVTIIAESDVERRELPVRIFVCRLGISVLKPELEDGMLVINTEDADPTDGVKIPPTELRLICVYKDKTGKNTLVKNGFEIDKLKPTDDITFHILCEFEYDLNKKYEDAGVYYINPTKVLPIRPGMKYIAQLPIKHYAEGSNIELDLPVWLKGEDISAGELEERDKEWELLKRACQRYGLTNNGVAQQMMRSTKRANAPASVLRQIRYMVCTEAIEYYTKEAEEMTELGDKMDRYVTYCQTAKWFGDQAFTYLIKAKFGDAAEMWATPLKDYFTTVLGEWFAAYMWDESYSLTFDKMIGTAETYAENVLMDSINNAFTGNTPPSQQAKKITSLIIGFVGINTAKHYWLDDECKGDVGKTCIAVLKDCTGNAFKAVFSNYLGKWLNKARLNINTSGEGPMFVRYTYMEKIINFISKDTQRADFMLRWNCTKIEFKYDKFGGTFVDAAGDFIFNTAWGNCALFFDEEKAGKWTMVFGDAAYEFSLSDIPDMIIQTFMDMYEFMNTFMEKATGFSMPTIPNVIPYSTMDEVEAAEEYLGEKARNREGSII